MPSNTKRIMTFGVIFYFISVLFYAPLELMQLNLAIKSSIAILIILIVAFVLSIIYFKKYPGDFKQGVMVGVIWLIIATIGDGLAFILLIATGNADLIDKFAQLMKPGYISAGIISLVLLVLLTGFAGKSVHGGALVIKK